MKKIFCFLFGHKDPVMACLGFVTQEKLYEMWLNWDRQCERCGENLKRD